MEDKRDAIYSYQPLWGTWLVDKLIGSGSFGRVYRIYHQDYGHTYTSVVKIITIPGAEQSRKTIMENSAERSRNTIIEPDAHGICQTAQHLAFRKTKVNGRYPDAWHRSLPGS